MSQDTEPTFSLLKHRRVEAARQTRTIFIVVLAGAIANIGYWFYRESGGAGFFIPMLILHTICVSIGVLVLRRYNANRSTGSN